ncbi:methyltransferase [Candidatus Woesearchaeota archaeon]|nr:methyltransferase [Candidatus Woesearchaeota archaeon]
MIVDKSKNINETMVFFSTFLKNPKEVSALIPTPKFLIDKLLEEIDFENAKYIAEYGAGTGCISAELLKRAGKDAKILCFELNRTLFKYLKETLNDDRLKIIGDSAEKAAEYAVNYEIPYFDYVISTLPFTHLEPDTKTKILVETKKILSNKGKFIFYKLFPLYERNLRKIFSRTSMKFASPCLVYVCGK